jgi:hypothetical protein
MTGFESVFIRDWFFFASVTSFARLSGNAPAHLSTLESEDRIAVSSSRLCGAAEREGGKEPENSRGQPEA